MDPTLTSQWSFPQCKLMGPCASHDFIITLFGHYVKLASKEKLALKASFQRQYYNVLNVVKGCVYNPNPDFFLKCYFKLNTMFLMSKCNQGAKNYEMMTQKRRKKVGFRIQTTPLTSNDS